MNAGVTARACRRRPPARGVAPLDRGGSLSCALLELDRGTDSRNCPGRDVHRQARAVGRLAIRRRVEADSDVSVDPVGALVPEFETTVSPDRVETRPALARSQPADLEHVFEAGA